MKAHVIHMPHRTDRMNNLMRQFEEQNITDYKIWDAIVHPMVTHVGVAKSHKMIVEFAKQNHLPEVLIMEDDVCFSAKGAFDYFLANKPKDFDIYLSSIYHGLLNENNTVDDFCGLHCYIVHERFYDTFIDLPIQKDGSEMHIDRAFMNIGKYIVCDPFIAYQLDGYSDNKKGMGTYKHLMAGRKFYEN